LDASLAAAAVLSGLALGWLSGPLADRIAAPRYGVDAEDHDPDDAALAPLEPPTTARQRVALAVVGGAGMLGLAQALEDGWRLAYFGALLFVYLAAMTVDLQYLRLPNAFTFPAAVLAAGGALALAAHEGVPSSGIWVGMVAYAGFLWFARLVYLLGRGREGMGLGDVKLALSLGASVGWLGSVGFDPGWVGALRLVVYAALLGNLLGAVAGLLVLRAVDREFPFGPSLVVGWLVVVCLYVPLTGAS
jgi:leader peptidase (prepilin peptidase)/N-methyltransferase